MTANATLTLTFDYFDNPLLFNMNFAFLVYTIGNGKIGNGPDDILPATIPPFNFTDSEDDTDLFNESSPAVSFLDRMIFAVQLYLSENFDQALIVAGSLLVVSVGVSQVVTTTRLKKETKGGPSSNTERSTEDV